MGQSRLLLVLTSFLLFSCGGGSPSSESSLSTSVSSQESTVSQTTEQTAQQTTEQTTEEGTTKETTTEEATTEEISSEFTTEESSSLPDVDPHELYGGYYASLDTWENGEDLIEKLHDIIHGGTYTPITYAGTITNWASNCDADEYLYDHAFVDAVYAKDGILKTGTNTHWQREHAFCASLMTGTTTSNAVKTLGRATDFHNLFASASSGNTSRGNKNYGVADSSNPNFINRFVDGRKDGYGSDPSNFEPGDCDKGRLSRAIFYMATMYTEEEYDSNSGIWMQGLKVVEGNVDYVAGDNCAFAIGNLSTLLKWSEFDVDMLEYQHNESVYSFVPEVHSDPSRNTAQGNRNPYVDFPGLVEYAFGGKKNEPGSLDDFVSSYETLGIGDDKVAFYAIDEAKRQYNQGEEFHLDDIKVVEVKSDLSSSPFASFSVEGAEEGKAITGSGDVTLTVKTPINDIPYRVLVETDPVDSATWKHKVTAKSVGDDFYGIDKEPGVAHTLNFDGVNWDVTYAEGAVASNSAALGCKFGTSTAPVKTLTFETTEEFSYNGYSNITGVYLRGCASSGNNYQVKVTIGEETVGTYGLGYIDTKTPVTVGAMYGSSKTGKIRIQITNIVNAVYVQYLAVHAL